MHIEWDKLKEISQYDCIESDCPLYDRCFADESILNVGLCDAARMIVDALEGEKRDEA